MFIRLSILTSPTGSDTPAPGGKRPFITDPLGAGNKNTAFASASKNKNHTRIRRHLHIQQAHANSAAQRQYTPAPADWEHYMIPRDLETTSREDISGPACMSYRPNHANVAAQGQHTGS
ncbi:hypothetical protein N7475_001372 [Penicillium sp. IBT 31633x]|nr:hypothetical protein N7475_001372 [Penicillium sp. IBT 31633x]